MPFHVIFFFSNREKENIVDQSSFGREQLRVKIFPATGG